jgi:uncharacterized protein YbbC (DUF1343 family)
MRVKNGLDKLLQDPSIIKGLNIGLVTNQTGVTMNLKSNINALHEHSSVNLVSLFGPEHGVRGDVQDAIPVESNRDRTTGLPVYSLYGESMKPTSEMLEGLDALVFDIQDVGARFYTFTSTLTYCMEAVEEANIPLIVLDRPNPLTGSVVEGNILEPGFASFLGLHPIPTRHGLTIGELALMVNKKFNAKVELVKMNGWERPMWFEETGLPWVQPSPNIPTVETAIVYPGTCLFEGVNVSEGRGTTRPFEYIGAPWINDEKWAEKLNDLLLPGVRFRASSFIPTFWRFKDEVCHGVQLHLTDRSRFQPVLTGLHMIATLLSMDSGKVVWEKSNEEAYHFDLLAGTDKTRKLLMQGASVDEISKDWLIGVEKFMAERRNNLLYPEDRP